MLTVRNRWVRRLGVTLTAAAAVLAAAHVPNAVAAEQVVVANGLQMDHGPGTTTLCTLGPVGTDNAGRLVGITAAHCHLGDDVYFPGRHELGPIGRYAFVSQEQAYLDYAVIEFDPAKVTLSSNGPALRIDSVYPGGLAPVGANVCKDGQRTGKACGLVTSNADGLIVSFAHHMPGDSGGPLVVARNDGRATEWTGIVTRIALTVPPFVYTSAKNILDDINSRGPDAPGAGFTPVDTP